MSLYHVHFMHWTFFIIALSLIPEYGKGKVSHFIESVHVCQVITLPMLSFHSK